MAQYRTKVLWQADGSRPPLPVGSLIDLSDADAALHLWQRTIEPVKAPEPEAPAVLTQPAVAPATIGATPDAKAKR